jgi:hypothetical protein
MDDQTMSTMAPLERLRVMLESFVQGRDQSKELVGQIEVLLRDQLEGTQVYEDLIFPVASFRPAGGPFTYTTPQLLGEFRHALSTHFGASDDVPK